MKTATLPSVRIEPALRKSIDSVLKEGESVSSFVESTVREAVQRRIEDAAFHARGIASIEHAKATGRHRDAFEVLDELKARVDRLRKQRAKA